MNQPVLMSTHPARSANFLQVRLAAIAGDLI
jgi:hypothetical protein